MAFPATPLAVAVELQLAGTWTDVSTLVRTESTIKIKRGRSNEASDVDPSTCALTFDNRDGRFSPRNPTGPYYGTLGRNTPLRVKVSGLTDVSLQCPAAGGWADTPHAAALNTASDLDVRVELEPYDTSQAIDLIGKWDAAGNQRGYLLWISAGGLLNLSWSTTGAGGAAQIDTAATVYAPRDQGRRHALRAQLTVNNGAGGYSVTFYYADSIAGPWLQLGDVVTGTPTTTVFACTASLRVARAVSSGGSAYNGEIYKAELRTGAGATTLAASPDFTAQTPGASSFTDAQSRTWTVVAPASLGSTRVRFVGEVSQWPVKWDPSGREVTVPIVASGILRRILANVPPLRSVLRRSLPALPALRAYWPMEDASGATTLAYGLTDLTGAYAMALATGASPAGYSAFAASDPIPTFGTGSYARGRVPPYVATTKVQARCIMAIPTASPPADGTVLLKLTTSTAQWSVLYRTANALQLIVTDITTGVALYTGPSTAFGTLLGVQVRLSLELTGSGANTNHAVATLVPGAGSGSVMTGTAVGAVPGQATGIQVGAPGTSSTVAIGHVTVESDVTSLFVLGQQLAGYAGEATGTRAVRLASEEGYTLYLGGPASTPMGPQKSAALIDLLRDCGDSNLGILYEPRGAAALAFRSRPTMYGRGPALTLDYPSTHLSGFEPVEDDQRVVNDVIVTRVGGSSYEAIQGTGTLSTQAPPLGVGRYLNAQSLSLNGDNQIRDQANYRLGLGTVDQPRYPVLSVELHRTPFTSSTARTGAALSLDLGDVLAVTNPPAFYSPLTVAQRVEGYTETIHPKLYRIDYNLSPAEIWTGVGIYSDPTKRTRWDAGASTLAAGVGAGATSLSIASGDGTLWTTAAGDWPFQVLIAGEVCTVTAVAGTSSPQTFTVTRAVNGVSKAQLAGAAVHLYPVAYYGF